MEHDFIYLDQEENDLLCEIEAGDWIQKPLSTQERQTYQGHAKYTKALQEKRQIKARSKEMGIGYQNLIQALVHNYAIGKIKLEV